MVIRIGPSSQRLEGGDSLPLLVQDVRLPDINPALPHDCCIISSKRKQRLYR